MSVFISDSEVNIFSESKAITNYFKPDERLVLVPGWGGAAVSIGACGASDSSANLDPDLLILK